jgi:hypothetical protein
LVTATTAQPISAMSSQGLDGEERDGFGLAGGFERLGGGDEFVHGAAVGLRVFGLDDEGEFVIRHRGAHFAREGAEKEAGGFLAGFEHVDVGVGAVDRRWR